MFWALLLVLNGMFWGLCSHSMHCKAAAMVGVKDCPPHWVHLAIGLGSFVGAIAVAQWGYLRKGLPY